MLLIEQYNITGKAVHDCNIVATIKAYNIKALLTNNISDFQRYRNEGFELIPFSEG
jgi:predicted nucleic acid-binding protein